VVPIPVGKAGPLTASIQLHTVAGFEGDAGFDIWLTGPGPAHRLRDNVRDGGGVK